MQNSLLKLVYLAIMIASIASTHTYANSNTDYLFQFNRVARVVVSPDGMQAAYTTFKFERKSGQWEYTLHRYDNKTRESVDLIKQPHISTLQWLLDGKTISYLAEGKKYTSIWLVQSQSKPKKFIELNRDIQTYQWSPDGRYIALLAADEKKITGNKKLNNVANDNVNSRIYVAAIAHGKVGKFHPVSPDNQHVAILSDIPPFTWSPDSQVIAYAFQAKPLTYLVNHSQIAIINIKQQVRKILPISGDSAIQPMFSRDGRWLAYQTNLAKSKVAMELNNDIFLSDRICLADSHTFSSHCLANTLNQNPQILGWSNHDQEVLVLDADRTTGYQIYALNIDEKVAAKNISNVDGFIEPLTVTLNDTGTVFGFGYEKSLIAPQVFMSKVADFKLAQLTQFQAGTTNILAKTEIIRWSSFDGKEIEGLLMTPINITHQAKYPLLVSVHGGPAGAWGKRYLGGCDEYEIMIDPSSCWGHFLNLGFAVFAPNPRGSSGYGRDFRNANYQDLGGGDFQDIMTGIDYLIKNNIADADRLAIAGWSFGGYMAAWATTQTQRFKVAIDGDGNTDFISFSGTSDIPDYYSIYLGTPFWDNATFYLKRAPINFVKNIQTPLLILHGEQDKRVPLSQSFELYTALSLQNKPVRFLVAPNQGHVPTDPLVIQQELDAITDWLLENGLSDIPYLRLF